MLFSIWLSSFDFVKRFWCFLNTLTILAYYIVSCELQLVFVQVDIYSPFNDIWIYHRIWLNESVSLRYKYLSWKYWMLKNLKILQHLQQPFHVKTCQNTKIPDFWAKMYFQAYIFSFCVLFSSSSKEFKNVMKKLKMPIFSQSHCLVGILWNFCLLSKYHWHYTYFDALALNTYSCPFPLTACSATFVLNR